MTSEGMEVGKWYKCVEKHAYANIGKYCKLIVHDNSSILKFTTPRYGDRWLHVSWFDPTPHDRIVMDGKEQFVPVVDIPKLINVEKHAYIQWVDEVTGTTYFPRREWRAIGLSTRGDNLPPPSPAPTITFSDLQSTVLPDMYGRRQHQELLAAQREREAAQQIAKTQRVAGMVRGILNNL